MEGEQKKLSVQNFSSKIKEKYPQYSEMDDFELAKKIVDKHPQYANQVDLTPKKKDNSNSTSQSQSSVSASENGSSVSVSVPKKDYGNRVDGTKKGKGYFGELKMKDGSNSIATEISIGVNIEGKDVEIPTLVPTLSTKEKDWLLKGNDPNDRSQIGESIVNKAIDHARKRISNKQSPFADNEVNIPNQKYKNAKEGTREWNQEMIKKTNPEITKLYDEYKSAKTVSDDRKKEIVNSVDAEINQEGIWNNIKHYGKKALNAGMDYLGQATGMAYLFGDGEVSKDLKFKTNPLEYELKEVDKQIKQDVAIAKKNNKPIPVFTEKEKIAKARDLKIEKEVKSESDSQVRSFIKEAEKKVDSFGLSDKDKLKLFQTSELASLSEKDKSNLATQNLQRVEVENIQSELISLAEKAKKGELTKEEYIQQGAELDKRYKSVIQDSLNTYEEFVSNKEKIGDVKDNIDVLKRNYGWLKNFVDNAGATGLDLTAGGVSFLDWLDTSPSNNRAYTNDSPLRKVSKLLTDTSKEVREGIAKPISVENINTVGDFGNWFWNTAVANQIPIYATIATGTGGIAALGASATGTKYEEMLQDQENEGVAYNDIQKTFVPIGYGASETISATVDRMVMMNAARTISAATLPERKMIAEGMWQGVKGTSKEIAKGTLYEGADESATEIMQNLMDIYALGKKDVGVFDNVLDAGAAGAIMGAIMPTGAGIISKSIKNYSIDNSIYKANKEILRLEKALDNPNLSVLEQTTIESQLNKAKVNSRSLLEKVTNNISSLSNEEFDSLKRIERTQANLKEQAKEIQHGELEQSLKDQIVSNLKEEFDAVEKQRIGILKQDANTILGLLPQSEIIRLKDEASRELLQEQDPEGNKTINLEDEEISKRALENYRKEKAKSKKVDETPQTKDIVSDENIQHGTKQLDAVQGKLENETQTNNEVQDIQPTETDRRPKVIRTSDNGREYSVYNDNNKVVFKDKYGNEPSANTSRKLALEYAKQVDLTEGKRAHENVDKRDLEGTNFMSTKESNNFIAENSNNPVEIAETILNSEVEHYRNDLDYKQSVIAEHIGYVGRQSFIDNSDAVHAKEGGSIPIQYLRKDGASLDTKAKELSEIAGMEITEQDIVDFILENPTGPQTFLNDGFNKDMNSLKSKFEEVTGLPATQEILNETLNQNKAKEELSEQMTSIDHMSNEDFVNLLKEIEAYEKDINTSTEELPSNKNSKKNEGEPRDRKVSTESNQGIEEEGRTREQERRILNESDFIIKNEISKIKEKVVSLFELAINSKQGTEKESIAELSQSGKDLLSDLSGLSFKNTTTIEINQSDLKHIYNDHFGNNEKDPGQNIPLTNEDIKNIPDVVLNPDEVSFLGYDERKQANKFEFKKSNGDGVLTIVQVYGKKGGRLSIKTVYNRKKGISQRPDVQASGITSENDFGASPSDANVQNIINLSKDLQLDKFIENLDKAIDKLDQFGQENLGMNLPLVVARQGLMAMKVAAKTAKSVADIISAGLNAVQQTEWYKNLSKEEQTDLDNNFVDYLNKPYETNKNTRDRSKVEKDIQNFLEEGKSEQEIIDSYSDRMEKMMVKDYFERQKEVDSVEAKKQVDDAFDKAEQKMDELTKPKVDLNKLFRGFVTKFFDRQFLPKFLLNKAGGRVVRDYIVTAKGAAGYAKYMYEKAYDKIYKGLSSDNIKVLDKVIQLRRFIAIDENRRANNMPAIVHPDYINDKVAKSYLEGLKKELGDKAYNDLIKRADAYFDTFKGLLNEMQESGIISKESRDRFFDVDYQPRQFLEFLQNKEAETANLDNGTIGGLGKEQIQKLENGLDSALITDSQYLLSRSLSVRAKTIAMNNTNNRLADFMKEQAEKVAELKKKDKPTQKEKDTIKYFEQLQKRVKENPIIGFTESGNPIYKHKKTPNGFSNAYYWVDGVKHNLLMEDEFHQQYFDSLKRIFSSPEVKEKFALASGTGLVKSIATGNNPTFFITNTPRDFLFISTFSEEYGKFLPLNMAKLTKDTALGIRDIKQENDTYKNFIKYGGMTDFLMDQGKFKNTQKVAETFEKVGIGNKGRERWNKFISAATLQKMQMYSEIGFRMGVFRRSIANQLKELGFKDISEVQDKRTVDDIYTAAASSARNTMDFNQGGTLTKDLDAFIPYLNAASQGTRVMFDNFRERPIETTLRVTQAAAFVAPIPIGLSLLAFGGSDREDNEKDLSSTELYLKALKGVSKYDRSNYFIIFNGKRTAGGEFEYYRIAKAQQLTPFFALAEGTLQKVMKESVNDKESGTTIEDLNWIFQNNISPVEFAVTDNLARNPIVKAALSMSTGYDFFREQDISPDRGKVPVAAEGFGSKSVEDFYKKIGENTGWSPARMKAATESIITTPSTSPYVGMIYGGMDAMFSDKDTEAVMQKFSKDMLKSSVNRVVKETSEYNRRVSNKEKIKDAVEEIEISRLKTKLDFKNLVGDLKEGKITKKDIDNEINELAKDNPFEAKRVAKRVKDQLQNQNTPSFVFEVKYANSAKEKAVLLEDKFGDALLNPSKMQEKEKEIMGFLKRNNAINRETLIEYQKLVK